MGSGITRKSSAFCPKQFSLEVRVSRSHGRLLAGCSLGLLLGVMVHNATVSIAGGEHHNTHGDEQRRSGDGCCYSIGYAPGFGWKSSSDRVDWRNLLIHRPPRECTCNSHKGAADCSRFKSDLFEQAGTSVLLAHSAKRRHTREGVLGLAAAFPSPFSGMHLGG